MYSPKKSKSKKKRVLIKNKRVPNWAADLSKVKDKIYQQKKDPNMDPYNIYGVCLV